MQRESGKNWEYQYFSDQEAVLLLPAMRTVDCKVVMMGKRRTIRKQSGKGGIPNAWYGGRYTRILS